MESNAEKSSETEKMTADAHSTAGDVLCKTCNRAISQTTGKCYYCAEPDPEDLKKLNFIMLDWQRQAASDPNARSTEKSRKVLSLIQALLASCCIALGLVPDFIPFQSKSVFFLMGGITAFSCWCFYFNSLTLIFAVLANASAMIFFLNLAFRSLPNLLIPAFICGFVASLSAFTLFLITVRIYKNKAVEI